MQRNIAPTRKFVMKRGRSNDDNNDVDEENSESVKTPSLPTPTSVSLPKSQQDEDKSIAVKTSSETSPGPLMREPVSSPKSLLDGANATGKTPNYSGGKKCAAFGTPQLGEGKTTRHVYNIKKRYATSYDASYNRAKFAAVNTPNMNDKQRVQKFKYNYRERESGAGYYGEHAAVSSSRATYRNGAHTSKYRNGSSGYNDAFFGKYNRETSRNWNNDEDEARLVANAVASEADVSAVAAVTAVTGSYSDSVASDDPPSLDSDVPNADVVSDGFGFIEEISHDEASTSSTITPDAVGLTEANGLASAVDASVTTSSGVADAGAASTALTSDESVTKMLVDRVALEEALDALDRAFSKVRIIAFGSDDSFSSNSIAEAHSVASAIAASVVRDSDVVAALPTTAGPAGITTDSAVTLDATPSTVQDVDFISFDDAATIYTSNSFPLATAPSFVSFANIFEDSADNAIAAVSQTVVPDADTIVDDLKPTHSIAAQVGIQLEEADSIEADGTALKTSCDSDSITLGRSAITDASGFGAYIDIANFSVSAASAVSTSLEPDTADALADTDSSTSVGVPAATAAGEPSIVPEANGSINAGFPSICVTEELRALYIKCFESGYAAGLAEYEK